jgi:PKD repeat protein
MGGLVGRYALRHMEIEGETHDTKLYISHDTPHQGANVPLAAQALVRHLVGEEISLPVFFSLFNVNIFDLENNFPELSEGLDLLQSPAAQQMLIYQLQGTGDGVSVNNNTLYSSFLNEYKTMGYPQQKGIRNIAIANGTECGNPLDFNPYDHIVNANIEVDLPFFLTNIALAIVNGVSINPLKFISSVLSTNTDLKAQFTLRALPSLQSKQIYKGRIYIKKTILFLITVHEPLIDEKTVNSSSNMLALDNANGGIYDIENFAELPTEFEQYVLQRRFNFIPAYSSLDVGSGDETINPNDLAKVYNPLSPPSAPKDIPFDNFFTNPISSEAHIQFTLNNGNWLISELTGTPEILSCALACESEIVISGSEYLCNGNTTSYNIPAGAENYTWQITEGSNLATISSSNNFTVNLTANNNNLSGSVILRGSISSSRCNYTEIIEKEIWIGKPRAWTVGFEPVICSGVLPSADDDIYSLPVSPGAETYHLASNSPYLTVAGYVNPGEGVFLYASQPGNYTITLTTSNDCGSKQSTIFVTANRCDGPGGLFSVYPNPSTEVLNIEKSYSTTNKLNTLIYDQNTTYNLFDFKLNLISKGYIKGLTTIDISLYKKGRYLLQIISGKNSETHHIIIE